MYTAKIRHIVPDDNGRVSPSRRQAICPAPAQGKGATLTLTATTLTIERRRGTLYQQRGSKEIRISQISAVQYRVPTMMALGFIQFSFIGGRESKGTTLISAKQDENTVTFTRGQAHAFEHLKRNLDRLMAAAQERKSAPVAAPAAPQVDRVAKLRELATMKQEGLLTDAEFVSAKADLLRQ